MKQSKIIRSEYVVTFLVLVLLGLLINPYWMPMGLVVVLLVALAVLIFGLGVFVWRESPKDEREYELVANAGRSAYLVGGLIMTVGVVVQIFTHTIDIWLVLALAAMIITKASSSYKKV